MDTKVPHTQNIQSLLSELRVTQFIKINQGYYFKNKLTIYTRGCSINRINTKNQKRLDFILKLHNEGYSNVEITNFLKLFGFKRRNKNDDYKVNDVWVCLKKLKLREERKKDTRMYWGDFEIWKIKFMNSFLLEMYIPNYKISIYF